MTSDPGEPNNIAQYLSQDTRTHARRNYARAKEEEEGCVAEKKKGREKENALVLAPVQPGTMSLCAYLNCDK